MKLQLERDGEMIDVKRIIIHIGETQYRISETNLKKLEVNKHDLDDTDILVKPCYANQVEIH